MGLATINEPPAFPMFANKSTKSQASTSAPALPAPAPAPAPSPTSQYTFYPYPFPFYNYHNSSPRFTSFYHHTSQSPISSHNISQITNVSIPKIQKFLEDLDDEFGSGKFTGYLENFINESIDVLDLLELTEKDFDKLGITNIGIRTKIVRKAKQCCK